MATNVTAHIAGTVWRIERRVGDVIADGDVILILESMKMEIPIEAPVAGTLAAITCAEGDAVAEDAVLAVVD